MKFRRALDWLRAFAQTTTYLGVVTIAVIWVGVAILSDEEREHAAAAAFSKADVLSRAFGAYISRVIKGADSTLLAMRESYEQDPQHFDLKRWIDHTHFESGLIGQLVVVGRDGTVKLSSIEPGPPAVNIADRDHFRVHVDSTTDALYISRRSSAACRAD